MPQKLIQEQTEQQVQTLTSLQVAMARMVELPLTDLRERIENEMLDNSALEENNDETDKFAEAQENGEAGESSDMPDEMGDYLTEDDIPSYLQARADASRERHEIPLSGSRSFYEELQEQIGEHDLTEHEREVMEYLIGSLDNSGFLRKDLLTLSDELAIYHNIDSPPDELGRLLGVLQQFEPRGIGARDLQECLRLQLTDPEHDSPDRRLALRVVNNYYKDFVGRHWDVLRQRLGTDAETFDRVLSILTHLNPAPGSAFSESLAGSAPTVVPDFFVDVDNEGNISVSLNNDGLPELRVSPAFKESIKQYGGGRKDLNRTQREAYIYARQKVDAAQNFINMLQRRNQTLFNVMLTITQLQADFFKEQDDESMLHPMTLKDVATRTGLDISTVSRVTASKYVETTYGTYPLKFFFSNQIIGEDGEEMSTRKVKLALRERIENENKQKPLSDEKLAEILQRDGYPIARRTVAKYREQLGLPPARLRKEMSKQ